MVIYSFGTLGGTPFDRALIRDYAYLGAAITAGLICQITARLPLDCGLVAVFHIYRTPGLISL